MFPFTYSNIVTVLVIVYLCIVAPSASGKIQNDTAGLSGYYAGPSGTKPTKPAGLPKPHNNRHSTSSPSAQTTTRGRGNRNRNRASPRATVPRRNATKLAAGVRKTRPRVATPTKRRRQNEQPTPEPTGAASESTTVYINGADSFALLLPQNPGELVSDSEEDAVAYCTDENGCGNPFPDGFITGTAYSAAPDGSYIQVTGCMDANQFPFASGDDGGQFDDRFPNGAQCTFGGYGASFIEHHIAHDAHIFNKRVEPSANRFCLRCCKSADDQENCNSHQDRAGCPVAVPGTYDFGEVDCS